MAGLYCDITLLASVGKETATNTISRQAILYSSSGLMFSAEISVLTHHTCLHTHTHTACAKMYRLKKKKNLKNVNNMYNWKKVLP